MCIRQPMETVSMYPYRVETAGNRKPFSYTRHGAMECRIKTSHLGKFWMTPPESLYQFNLTRQMLRILRRDTMKFIKQFMCNKLGTSMIHTMNHAMAHSYDRRKYILFFEPIHQKSYRGVIIGNSCFKSSLLISCVIIESQC